MRQKPLPKTKYFKKKYFLVSGFVFVFVCVRISALVGVYACACVFVICVIDVFNREKECKCGGDSSNIRRKQKQSAKTLKIWKITHYLL